MARALMVCALATVCTLQPRAPQSQLCGHHGQIDMPDVVGTLGGDGAAFGCHGVGRFWLKRWLDGLCLADSAYRRGSQVETGSCQDFGQFLLSQSGAYGLNSLDGIADEVWELVDWNGDLDQRRSALLINALHPRGNRFRADEEDLCCLFKGPAPAAFNSRIARRSLGR
jgi:hypothetical protein